MLVLHNIIIYLFFSSCTYLASHTVPQHLKSHNVIRCFQISTGKKETALFLNVLCTDNIYGELMGHSENKSTHHQSKEKITYSVFPRLITSSPLVLALSHVWKENTVHVKCANDSDKIKLMLCHLLQTLERCLECKKVDVFSLHSALVMQHIEFCSQFWTWHFRPWSNY